MNKIDISDKIERLTPIEIQLGISLSGLSAFLEDDIDKNLSIYGELLAADGSELRHDIRLTAAAYDTSGKIIGAADSYHNAESFVGIEIFELFIILPSDDVAKIKIIPKTI